MPITISPPYDPATMSKPDVEIVIRGVVPDTDVMQYSTPQTKVLEGDKIYVINGDWYGVVHRNSSGRLQLHIDFTNAEMNIREGSTYADVGLNVCIHQAINKHGNFSQIPAGSY